MKGGYSRSEVFPTIFCLIYILYVSIHSFDALSDKQKRKNHSIRSTRPTVPPHHGDAEAPYVRLDTVALLVQVRVDPLGLKGHREGQKT